MRRMRGSLAGWLVAAVVLAAGQVGVAAQSGDEDAELDAALAAVELMNRVPAGIRETCRPTEAFIAGMRAAVECEVAGGLVFYARFPDAAGLSAAYEGLRASSGLDADTGAGCATEPTETSHGDQGGQADGRVLCHVTNGARIAVWTEDADVVLGGILLDSEADLATLEAAWQAARLTSGGAARGPGDGTVDAPLASTSPGPGSPAPRPTVGEVITQWATSAIASTEYAPEDWSARQATGEPDTTSYGDYVTAWAPAASDGGEQWLELGYDEAVVPTEVVVWESSGAGFVTRVEARDVRSGAWVTLWEGVDGSPDFLVGFSPPLRREVVVTDRLRVTIDTDVPGWNEIDAVALIGLVPG